MVYGPNVVGHLVLKICLYLGISLIYGAEMAEPIGATKALLGTIRQPSRDCWALV